MPATISIHFAGSYTPAARAKSVVVHFGPTLADVTADLASVRAAPTADFNALGPVSVAFIPVRGETRMDAFLDAALPVFMATTRGSPTFQSSLFWNSLAFRGVESLKGQAWQEGEFLTPEELDEPWQDGVRVKTEPDLLWNPGSQLIANSVPGWDFGEPLKQEFDLAWEKAQASMNLETSSLFQLDLPHLKPSPSMPWQVADHLLPNEVDSSFVLILPHLKPLSVLPWGEGVYFSPGVRQFKYNKGVPAHTKKDIPWGEGIPPAPGVGPPPPGPPVPPGPPPGPGFHGVILHFICPWLDYGFRDVPLHFGLYPCEEANPAEFVVPIRRLYMIYNQFSMKRVDDNTPIEISDVDISADQASWCWTFGGTIPGSELDKVMPDVSGPVEVEVTINAMSWRFWIESYDRRRTFGDTGVTIRGRSVTAQLDAPYAPVRTYTSDADYYSKALAQFELDRVPGPTWGLDWPDTGSTIFKRYWDADDGLALGWSIPTGSYSYSGLTPMAALNMIAGSVGAYVQSHRTAKTVIFNSGYPKGPWNWAASTPDIIIPKSILLSDGLAWEEKPQYNRVYATGRQGGVNVLVRRTAMPDLEAQQYLNDLITAQEAGHEVGKTIISAGGKQARVTIEVPLDPTIGLGVVNPGLLVKVIDPIEPDWFGLTRALGIKATATDKDITVHQSIQLERHY